MQALAFALQRRACAVDVQVAHTGGKVVRTISLVPTRAVENGKSQASASERFMSQPLPTEWNEHRLILISRCRILSQDFERIYLQVLI